MNQNSPSGDNSKAVDGEDAAQKVSDYVATESFAELPLSPAVLSSIAERGYTQPTPVQAAVIPPILAGSDLIVRSKTGTGKTAAFGIPLVEAVDLDKGAVQALVLCNTRELALQVSTELAELEKGKGVSVVAIYGGASMDAQVKALAAGAHIAVGTPGRILDLLERKTLSLKRTHLAVLDEADEMLGMGFYEDVMKILGKLPAKHQTLLFSATISPEIEHIVQTHLKSPETILLSGDTFTVEGIDNVVYFAQDSYPKPRNLLYMLHLENPENAIVFCNTRDDVNLVATVLDRNGYEAERLSGELPQKERERVMAKIKRGEVQFMVATDLAARGIDISDLSHVINYSLPEDPAVYLHRIGRTGRIGKSGTALSLVRGTELVTLSALQKRYGIKFEERKLPTPEEARKLWTRSHIKELRESMGTLLFDAYLPLAQELKKRDDGDLLVAFALKYFFTHHRKEKLASQARSIEAKVPAEKAAKEPEARRERGRSGGPQREDESGKSSSRRRRQRRGRDSGRTEGGRTEDSRAARTSEQVEAEKARSSRPARRTESEKSVRSSDPSKTAAAKQVAESTSSTTSTRPPSKSEESSATKAPKDRLTGAKKDASSRAQKEARKEAQKETQKEAQKESRKETKIEAQKESRKETKNEAQKEIQKESQSETPRKARKAAQQEAQREEEKEAQKEAEKDGLNESQAQASKPRGARKDVENGAQPSEESRTTKSRKTTPKATSTAELKSEILAEKSKSRSSTKASGKAAASAEKGKSAEKPSKSIEKTAAKPKTTRKSAAESEKKSADTSKARISGKTASGKSSKVKAGSQNSDKASSEKATRAKPTTKGSTESDSEGKSAKKSESKPESKSASSTGSKPSTKTTSKTTAKAESGSAKKPATRTARKASETSGEKSATKTSAKSASKSGEKTEKKPVSKSKAKPAAETSKS